MKIFLRMCRHLARHHPVLAVFIILYFLGGSYISFGNFHHVHLGWIAGIDYQAQFEAGAARLKYISFLFIMLPLFFLYLEFYLFNRIPSGLEFIKKYRLNIFPSWITLAFIFYCRQDPEMVTGNNCIFIPLFLLTWLTTSTLLAGLKVTSLTRKTRQ
ncbi:hypothetical protein [Pantoea cypripedii]|uniref:hypothetical protein n=1 Tax=Pantoea cypripedii TaxID=55209 RepID=UPI00111BD3F0|nr:hypothetical protein [Pantoea cypripedii]MBP2199225.1 hypothetical protein [Pantoea cypripedii]